MKVERIAWVAVAVAAGWSAPGAGAADEPAERQRPNIVLIYTDDHGAWALGLEHPQVHTPRIDRLFGDGARLTNAFVTTPVCSPSRASLFTGRYATEVQIFDWISPSREKDVGLDPNLPTWPALLSEAGYTTALIGKWHLGTADRFHPTRLGFDEFVGFRGHGPPADPTLEIDRQPTRVEGLTIDVLTDHVLDFIDRHRAGPFVVMLSTRSPHRDWESAEVDQAPYRNVDLEIPDYPGIDEGRVRHMMRQYLASVTSIDRNVGRILDRLDELDLTRNTVVIFTANEGNSLGHHGAWGKGNAVSVLKERPVGTPDVPGDRFPNLMDTVLRVPAAVRWPNVIPPGTTITRTVNNLDWFPTLLAMAGVDPSVVEKRGRNMLPLLRGESLEWDDDLYAEYSPHHGVRAHMRAWRTPRWKLVRDFLNPERDGLYDLHNDPQQRHSLVDDARREVRTAKRRLHERIIEKMRQLNDPVLGLVDDRP